MPRLPSVTPETMKAANAGPSSPGKWVDREPGPTRTPAISSGIQYAHDRPYARTKNVRTGCLRTNDSTIRPFEEQECSKSGEHGQRQPDGKFRG